MLVTVVRPNREVVPASNGADHQFACWCRAEASRISRNSFRLHKKMGNGADVCQRLGTVDFAAGHPDIHEATISNQTAQLARENALNQRNTKLKPGIRFEMTSAMGLGQEFPRFGSVTGPTATDKFTYAPCESPS